MLCAAVDCDDGNACTDDACDPVNGSCEYANVSDGTSCDFGGFPGVCISGACVSDECSVTDCDPPVLTAFDFTPQTVYVFNGPETVTCSISVTDVPAGADHVDCEFHPPSGVQRGCRAYLTSGTANDGTFTCDVSIPQYAAEGSWNAVLVARDTVGNATVYHTADLANLGLPTQLDVISSPDIDGPILTAFDFDPKNVDVTSQPAEVSFSMSFSDVPSGVALAHVQAVSPNAIDTLFCLSQTPVSGDVFDGTWTCTMTIPQGVEPGAYRIIVQGGDALDNYSVYQESELQALGFPTQLDVFYDIEAPP
jgi:hypothetical protein